MIPDFKILSVTYHVMLSYNWQKVRTTRLFKLFECLRISVKKYYDFQSSLSD